MRRLILALAGLVLTVISGCEKYVILKPEIEVGVSYSTQVQPIFDNNCVMCHSGNQHPHLAPDESYDELTSGGYLDTITPGSSKIYLKLTSPPHDARATEEEKLTILQWITEGALNN